MSNKTVIKNYAQQYKCSEEEARARFNLIQKLCTNDPPTYRAIWQALQEKPTASDKELIDRAIVIYTQSIVSNNNILVDPNFPKPPTEKDAIYDTLDEQSDILRKYGYNAKKGFLLQKRRDALKKAVIGEGILKVERHLLMLVNTRRNNRKMEDAIVCWEDDLEFLSNHYNRKEKRFF